MRAHLPIGLALIFGLASCHTPVAGGPASPGPGKASTTPGPRASAAPVATAGLLKPLAGETAPLSGKVLVDQDYVSRRGGGNLVGNAGGTLALLGGGTLVGNAGGTLVGNAGGTLVGNAGGTLVGNAGGTLVGNAGGTLVGNAGGTLITNDGAGLVADRDGRIVAAQGGNVIVPAALVGATGSSLIGLDGSALITNDGGGLINNGGSTLINNGGSTYRLAQATPAAFGQTAPAVGMWLSAVDARTGFTLPLGTDAAGKPVYTVYTDLDGSFKVQVPAEAADHVRLVARAPGLADRRLAMSVFASKASAATIDDDQAAVTAFLRQNLQARLFSTLTDSTAGSTSEQLAQIGLADVVQELTALRQRLEPRALEELTTMVADATLTEVEPSTMRLTTVGADLRNPASAALAGQPVVLELAGVLRRLREAAAGQVQAANAAADPATFFAAKPYLVAANMLRGTDARYRIERPADVASFLVQEYFGSNDPAQRDKAFLVFDDLGLDVMDRDRVAMASGGLVAAVVADALKGNDTGQTLNQRMLSFIHAAAAQLEGVKLATEAPRPAPPLPTAPPFGPVRMVDTVAGQPGAPLGAPMGLALDPSADPPVLYVSEATRGVILRLTFDAAGVATASTLPGQAGYLAGLLAHDGAGHLYVGSRATNTVYQVSTRPEDLGTATLLAGAGEGFRDGPGASAQFGEVDGIAIDPISHDLLVADMTNRRIRRIALADPLHAVSTVAGTGSELHVEGPLLPEPGSPPGGTVDAPRHPGMQLMTPMDVAFDASGSVYFVEFSIVHLVPAPLGPTARSRFVAGDGMEALADAFYTSARLYSTVAGEVDPQGNLVTVQREAGSVHLVTRDGWSHLIAGGGEAGYADGPGPTARFREPVDVAVAKDGTIYVADKGNGLVRRLKP